MLAFLGVPLLLATSYFGVLLLDQIEITNAAHAGAMYAMTSSTFAEDTANIQAAAQAETNRFGSNLTVTPSIYYACSTANQRNTILDPGCGEHCLHRRHQP